MKRPNKSNLGTPLETRCSHSFSDVIQSRGHEYFEKKAVGVFEVFRNGLRVQVQGTHQYKVVVYWGKAKEFKSLTTSCTCPYFQGENLCKHVWATFLEIDKQGLSVNIQGVSPLHVLIGEKIEGKLEYQGPGQEAVFEKQAVPLKGDLEKGQWLSQLKSVLNKTPYALTGDTKHNQKQSSKLTIAPIYYALDLSSMKLDKKLWIHFYHATPQVRAAHLHDYEIHKISDTVDRQTLSLLFSFTKSSEFRYNKLRTSVSFVTIDQAHIFVALYSLISTGRFYESRKKIEENAEKEGRGALAIDYSEKFIFQLSVAREYNHYRLQGHLKRKSKIINLSEIKAFFDSGIFLYESTFYRVEDSESSMPWIENLVKDPQKYIVPVKEAQSFLETLLNGKTQLDLPKELDWPRKVIKPKVKIICKTNQEVEYGRKWMWLHIEFDYKYKVISASSMQKIIVNGPEQIFYERNFKYEKQVLKKIEEMGAESEEGYQTNNNVFHVPFAEFVDFANKVMEKGWEIQAEGREVRQAGEFNVRIKSGTDWFDMEAQVKFGDYKVSLPELLKAAEKQEKFIQLGDGTWGMLPEEWIQKYSSLASLGVEQNGELRFKSNQAILLDAWLGEEKNIKTDKVFKEFQSKIRNFRGIKQQSEPKTFAGKLRPYQREGLSWFDFLEEFGVGGILADDMGLGKTIQCLALFEKQRIQNLKESKSKKKFSRLPNLVVAPKSLVFNWIDEGSKFTPHLKIMNYTGFFRESIFNKIKDYDIVVTTYQTLRRDIEKIKDIQFSCAVIDEAQAIKNEGAQVSKATKLIKAKFKLAMTGTPVENSIKDLFSISEFVNPGLLGRKAYDKMAVLSGERGPSSETLKNLSVALKPFILRRTKSQVLKDLPEKTEQVIHLDLNEKQKSEYDELRDYFRESLDRKIERDGYKKSQIQVLTALLRLRQAALHPGLIDAKRVDESSAKLDALIENIMEITSEGHKTLVFSQFTKFLSIIKMRLEKEKINFQYLDGQTQNRKSVVDHFKSDKGCKVFLMSLKAGGVGLNLVEADYVFLLDPWWNPAVESQAIDRVHRIGQKNKVFAYKFIAKDTVEEKILELQKTKKMLSDSVISTDKGFLKNMTAQDLKILLS